MLTEILNKGMTLKHFVDERTKKIENKDWSLITNGNM